MARVHVPDGDGPEQQRVWAAHPTIGRHFGAMATAIHKDSQLPAREREAARMRIAQLNACPN